MRVPLPNIPLKIGAPAGLAVLSYLNAKWQIGNDLNFLKTAITNILYQKRLESADRANVFYILEQQASNSKIQNRVFIWFEGRTWTFKQAYDIVLQYASYLKSAHQVATGETIAVDCMNDAKFIWITLAIWSLGAKPAYINYNLTAEPLVHCVKAAKARVVFYDDKVAHQFTQEVRDAFASPSFLEGGKGIVELVELGPALEDKISTYSPLREPDSVRSGAGFNEGFDKLGALIFTSGTTGLPKPAIVSWAKLHGGGLIMYGWGGVRANDVYYTCMPLYHSTATLLAFMPCLYAGATLAIGQRFSNKTFWPEVRASGSTIIQYVGETCRYLLSAPPIVDPATGQNLDKVHSVRMAFGNGMRPDVWDRFKERFGIETIGEFYSATESPQSSWNLSRNDFSSGAIGRAGLIAKTLFGGRYAIVQVDYDTEEPRRDPHNNNYCVNVDEGSPGELIFKLDPENISYSFQGYFGNEKASEKKILRNVFEPGDVYFRSGDVIRIDSEGRQYFIDRIGDTFRWRSENVSTNEVSEALGRHPAISEANVYGVELPHHDGRAGCAAVTVNRQVTQELMNELGKYASSKLAKFAVPLFLRITQDQMVTGNNKQQKHIFRNQGVDLSKVPECDEMWMFNNGTYQKFTETEWERLKAGQLKL